MKSRSLLAAFWGRTDRSSSEQKFVKAPPWTHCTLENRPAAKKQRRDVELQCCMNYDNKDAGQKQEETGGFCTALASCVSVQGARIGQKKLYCKKVPENFQIRVDKTNCVWYSVLATRLDEPNRLKRVAPEQQRYLQCFCAKLKSAIAVKLYRTSGLSWRGHSILLAQDHLVA